MIIDSILDHNFTRTTVLQKLYISSFTVLCSFYISQVTIGEGSHPDNVKVHGPGVEKTGLKANEPTYFTVDCSEAGQGQIQHNRYRNTYIIVKFDHI